ncbi:MAG: hypothetical protein R6W76_12245 [Caldilinea sp.]
MTFTRKEQEMAVELVRLRKLAVNARLRVEEALNLTPENHPLLRKKLQSALASLEAASPKAGATLE